MSSASGGRHGRVSNGPSTAGDHRSSLRLTFIRWASGARRLVRVASEPSLDLLCDAPPKVEPLPASRTSRSLLLQKGELACSGQTMLIAQTLNHGQHAHTVRDRLHLGQFSNPPDERSPRFYVRGCISVEAQLPHLTGRRPRTVPEQLFPNRTRDASPTPAGIKLAVAANC